MEQEINAGYVITDRLAVGDYEFVIGEREEAPANFVTWKCKTGEKEFFWRHYLGSRLAAVEDLCKRALEEARFLKNSQREQSSGEEPVKQVGKKKYEPER